MTLSSSSARAHVPQTLRGTLAPIFRCRNCGVVRASPAGAADAPTFSGPCEPRPRSSRQHVFAPRAPAVL